MNTIFQISKLIIKKKLKVLTPTEKSKLKTLKKAHPFLNKTDFSRISRNISAYETIDKERAWTSVLLKMQQPKRKQNNLFLKNSIVKYAAIAVLFIGIGIIYQQGYFTAQSTLNISIESVTLQLENGSKKIINEDGSSQILDQQGNVIGSQNGSALTYDVEVKSESLVYNTLTVPYGKRFELKLSDGTKVHLNAGTSLKYPVNFIQNQNRQVFLNGEAFFEVSKDEEHPFIVNTETLNVRVLGTKFNVSSYPEDDYITTVLQEGAVGLYASNEAYDKDTVTVLDPGFMANWNISNNSIEIDKANTKIHTAWMDGKLILNGMMFNDILKKLERQYNVVFINNNKALESRRFTARFDVENIYQVLESFSYSASFNYKFDHNKIIINP